MLNKKGDSNQGLLLDSKYYNFVIARKILFFITFFSRYLFNIYNIFRERNIKQKKFKRNRFWRDNQNFTKKDLLSYLFTIKFKRYYSKRRELMFILALNKFLWKEVLLPLRKNKIDKVCHDYDTKLSFDFRIFLMMVEVFHRVIISTAFNYVSQYSAYPIWKFRTLNVRMKKIYYLLLRYHYATVIQPYYFSKYQKLCLHWFEKWHY